MMKNEDTIRIIVPGFKWTTILPMLLVLILLQAPYQTGNAQGLYAPAESPQSMTVDDSRDMLAATLRQNRLKV